MVREKRPFQGPRARHVRTPRTRAGRSEGSLTVSQATVVARTGTAPATIAGKASAIKALEEYLLSTRGTGGRAQLRRQLRGWTIPPDSVYTCAPLLPSLLALEKEQSNNHLTVIADAFHEI